MVSKHDHPYQLIALVDYILLDYSEGAWRWGIEQDTVEVELE